MSTDRETLIRISELERRVQQLYRHLDLAEPEPGEGEVSEQVAALVAAGDMSGAISAYRNEAGIDLASAKQFIDDYSARRRGS